MSNLTAGWFKASTRWHHTDDGGRSLCGAHEAPTDPIETAGGRQCARCARLAVANIEDATTKAYLATLGPPQKVTITLTDAQKADAASLASVRKEQKERATTKNYTLTQHAAHTWTVTEPTLLDDVPDSVYHAGGVRTPGPQVSQSGLKMLRPPSTPREFQHYIHHGLPNARALDFGRAVHTVALGKGDRFAVCPADKLGANGARNTRAAREWEAQQRAAGITPLSQADRDGVYAAAEELLRHPEAGELLTDPAYRAEVSAYHEATPGLWMRARFDLTGDGSLDDVKTAKDPHPDAWRKQAWNLGYHVQDVAYRRAHVAVTGRADPGPMRFIVVGNTAPYLVGVYTLDADFERLGAEQLDAALALYAAQYAKHGDPKAPGVRWDGLPIATAVLSPPRHAHYDAEGVDYEPEF